MSFSAQDKVRIVCEVIKGGISPSSISKKYGIPVRSLYRWIEIYKKAASFHKKRSLAPKYASGLNHPRSINLQTQKLIKRIIFRHPIWGCRKIGLELEEYGLKVGYVGVYNYLKKMGVETEEKRLLYRKLWSGPGRIEASIKLSIARKIKAGETIANISKGYNIPRRTLHRWIKIYKSTPQANILGTGLFKEAYAVGEAHPRAIYPKIEEQLLNLVAKNPELSVHRLTRHVAASSWTIWSILNKNGLSLYHQRLAFAQSRTVSERKVIEASFWDRIKLVWEQFIPSLAPAPPPPTVQLLKAFGVSSGISFIFFFGFIWWIRILGSTSFAGAIGIVFASMALLFGFFFFLYSLKYYLTLAIVLSFSQGEQDLPAGKAGSGRVEGKKKGLLSWLLGIGPSFAKATEGENGNGLRPGGPQGPEGRIGPAGLEPNLDHIILKRHPVISVHIPLYNEKNVVERLIKASTSFDYPPSHKASDGQVQGNYEVILCDDSTDETSQIIRNYLQTQNSKLKTQKGEGWELTQAEVRPGVTLKHLHRTSRTGFKGGALRLALSVCDPRAEFISVFDADFVPYPDTLALFLKYFQVSAGSLDFARSTSKSNIAAVQGYQWHVLNKSENWITRGVRSEYAGSYVIERSGIEIYGGLKQISGSVYMVRRDVLNEVGWETSITEDFELTLKLYEAGYKVVYTPYIQAPAECVSTIKRLIRQRMRWAEGHSHNIRKMFVKLLFGKWEERGGETVENGRLKVGIEDGGWKVEPKGKGSIYFLSSIFKNQPSTIYHQPSKVFVPSPLSLSEKLEFLYLSPYYLQAFFFLVGTLSWLISETIFRTHLPFWTELWGWSLVLTNLFALPLMNAVGLFLEESEEKDYAGLASFIALSYILVPFQAYASLKGLIQREEGPWFRTPKTGRITDIFTRGKFFRFIAGILPRRNPAISVQNLATNFKSLTSNNYLALSTANSRFMNFSIRRRGSWVVGKVILSLCLIFTTVLLTLAPLVPSFSHPTDVQASTFGMLEAPEQAPPEVSSALEPSPGEEAPLGKGNKIALNTVQNRQTKALARAGDYNLPNTKLKFANGLEMDFPFTDENSGESLIIRSDRDNYYELAKAEVNFSVTNIGPKEEWVDFQVYFPESGGEISKLEKWTKNISYEIEVGDLAPKTFVCEGEWQEFNDEKNNPIGYKCSSNEEKVPCDKLSEDKRRCLIEKYQVGTHKETRYMDDWRQMDIKDGQADNAARFPSEKKKPVPAGFVSVKHVGNNLTLPGETQFFRMEIGFPMGSSGEFFIEAIGDKEGYGLLDPWWNSSWLYKRPVPVTYSGSSLSNFQIKVEANTKELVDSGKLQSDCDDIRFVDSDDATQIDYWIESGCNTTETDLWVEVPSITGNKTIFMYYGNGSATAGSNGDNTFDKFDDFPGTSLDSGKWNDYNPNSWGTLAVASSILTITMPSTGGTSNAYTRGIMSTSTFSFSNHVVEIYNKWTFNTMSANTQYVVKQIHLADTSSPTRICSYQFSGDGNQYKWAYERYYGIFGINVHQYHFAKCTSGSYSEIVKITNLTNDAPSSYEWEKYQYYTGPNQTSGRATDGDTFSTLWAAQTDTLFTLPASLYWGFSGNNRSSPNTHYAYLDWIRIRKYASTEPTTSVGAETSTYPTAYSFQRKTFYDSTNSVYWRFSYDGGEIDIDYNSAPWSGSWTATTSQSVNTSDFSVWDDNTYVYIAYASTYDVRVKRGTLGSTSITWGSEYTALDGTGDLAFYQYSYISQDSSGILWVTGRYHDGTNYYLRARPSSSANDPSAWGTVSDLSSTSGTDANVYGVISSLGSQNMYATWIRGTAIEGKKYTSGSGWDGSATSIGTGKSGLASNISMSSDTSNNLHLAYIDGSNFVQYKKHTSSWDGSPTRLDTAATNEYVTVSVDTGNSDIYVLYIRSGVAYYKKYSGSWGSETNTGWTMGTSPVYLTSNYADSGRIYAEWSSGSAYPYTLNWNYIIIPEYLWLFLPVAPFLPLLLKRKTRRWKVEGRR